MRGLLHQIITSSAELHANGILHRDLKPSNIIMNIDSDAKRTEGAKIVIADFSSAISDGAYKNGLYGFKIDENDTKTTRHKYEGHTKLRGSGSYLHPPTQHEETLEYAPPEVVLCSVIDRNGDYRGEYNGDTNKNNNRRYTMGLHDDLKEFAEIKDQKAEYKNDGDLKWQGICAFDESRPLSYDVWSIGIIFLEIILGTANIFTVDQRTSALIAHKIRRRRSRAASTRSNSSYFVSFY